MVAARASGTLARRATGGDRYGTRAHHRGRRGAGQGAGAVGQTAIPGGIGWDGGSGTSWRTDTESGLTGILLTQRMMTSPELTELARDFWAAGYAAIDG
jgi:CubicO group peptidase (beta-lactamase class C family)